ncbi:MAG: PHP domain-containing protein [Longimicrobiales bacterium]
MPERCVLRRLPALRRLLPLRRLVGFLLLPAMAGCAAPLQQWKGNLHTHSVWSDGTDYPEMIVDWYRTNGYHFLSLTEHDLLAEGERWLDINAPDDGWPPRNRSARRALPGYRERFGSDQVREHRAGDRHLVRLSPLAEYRQLFEQPGRFLLLEGEEITDREGAHVNAFNLSTAILPRGGASAGERIRNNLAAVEAQRVATGRPIIAIVNHPNFVWALTAEDLAAIPNVRIFEVFNGHMLVNSEGDAEHAGTERIWDVALSLRHAAGLPPIFAAATDDAHDYREYGDSISRPGRGWIMVRAPQLTSVALAESLLAGEFYASTGVTIRREHRDQRRIRIEIEPASGAAYRTLFIGTRVSTPLAGTPVLDAAGDTVRTTRIHDAGMGAVLAEVEGTVAEYVFRGDERYVRAKVVSSRSHVDPTTGKVLGRQTAWLQPVFRR